MTTGPMARARNSRWLQPRSAPEALLHGTRIAPRHRQPDQVAELGLNVRALGVGECPHVGRGVDNPHVGAPDHQAEVHEVEVAGAEVATGPRTLIVQGAHDGEVVAAVEHLHGDRAAVDGILAGARRRTEGGEGRRRGGVRHGVIVALWAGWAPTPPR